MASRCILMKFRYLLLIASSFLIINMSCSTSSITSIDPESVIASKDLDAEVKDIEELADLNIDGIPISTLADLYASQQNEIPPVFERIKTYIEQEVDLSKGFRIQIYSGESVADADTIAAKFRGWVSTSIEGYQAETYTFFKTPHYRVHIGDFHNRERALTYSRLVKREFKDAWVVYDTVDPFMIPADTVAFSIR